jgi:hypothetical protein
MESNVDDLLSEKEVYDRYGKLLADRELREARQNQEIEWFDLRKGPHYTKKDLMAYLERRKIGTWQNDKIDPAKESPTGSSKSAASGSAKRPAATISSITGMTRQLEERAARQLDAET